LYPATDGQQTGNNFVSGNKQHDIAGQHVALVQTRLKTVLLLSSDIHAETENVFTLVGRCSASEDYFCRNLGIVLLLLLLLLLLLFNEITLLSLLQM